MEVFFTILERVAAWASRLDYNGYVLLSAVVFLLSLQLLRYKPR